MPKEIVVEAEDRPGMMASLGELFGEAGLVNITAAAAVTYDGRGFLTSSSRRRDRAMSACGRRAGRWSRQEVLSISLDDRRGSWVASPGVGPTLGDQYHQPLHIRGRRWTRRW